MKFRKIRIVFSALCGLASILLIVLWVRSYWLGNRADDVSLALSGYQRFFVDSFRGKLILGVYVHKRTGPRWAWTVGPRLPHPDDGWTNYDANVRAWRWV